jgi:hypothetical protein
MIWLRSIPVLQPKQTDGIPQLSLSEALKDCLGNAAIAVGDGQQL